MSHYGYVSEQLLPGWVSPPRLRRPWRAPKQRRAVPRYDVERVRSHFDFPGTGRVVTNNAATSQTPRELIDLYRTLSPWYESIHRGQSAASRQITATFEESFDTIATWVNAPSRRSIATYKNTTEAINAVMYSLLTEFRDGDNVVTTLMEHNSNYVPWHALTHEVLPRLGRRVECRVARFDHHTGQLDLDHLAELVDHRTKLVCVTGASNFLGTKPPLDRVRQIATDSGYPRPEGTTRPGRWSWSTPPSSPPPTPSTWPPWTSTTSPSPSTRSSPPSASGSSTPAKPSWNGPCHSSTAAT